MWLLALAGVMAFIGWEWRQSPEGLVPTQGMVQTGPNRQDDDDD